MEGSNAVVETRRQKAVCLMLVPKDERRMYLSWIFDPHLEINVINMSCMDIHEPFQQERLFELLFQSTLKATELEVHMVGCIHLTWVEHIQKHYDWVRVSYGMPAEVEVSRGEGIETSVNMLMHLLQADPSQADRLYQPLEGMLSIDMDSMYALGILRRDTGGSCIFDMASAQCMTVQGKKCMKEWFMLPLISEDVRASRLDMVEGFILNRHVMSSARKILKRIGNPWSLVETLWKNQTLPKPQDQTRNFMKLRDALESLLKLQEVCQIADGCSLLSCLSQNTAGVIQQLGSLINKIIDPDQLPEGMCVQYGVSQELDSLKSTYFGMDTMMKQLVMLERERIPKYLRRSQDSDIFSWEMIHIHQVGVFVHCPSGLVPFYLEEYLPDWNLAFEPGSLQEYQGALYSTDSCMQLFQRFGSVFPTIVDLEASICTKLTDKILRHKNILKNAFHVVANLDCIIAFAKFSLDHNFTRPVYSREDHLRIHGGWNPILQCIPDVSTCIPNDTILDGGRRTHVIIGKGGTGKSVYLQQVAIIVFLGHIGCYVPAKQATIPMNIDRICCMLSTQESLRDSSFSHGLGRILEMLRFGSKQSLLLIESFGKGTVCSDGIALAVSIIKRLSQKCGILMFATHMGQLFLDQLDLTEQRMWDVYFLATVPSTISMGNQTNLFKLIAGKEAKDQGMNCTILCEACPLIMERARHVLDLMSTVSLSNTLARHPKFSILDRIERIQAVKNIRSKEDAVKFIEDDGANLQSNSLTI